MAVSCTAFRRRLGVPEGDVLAELDSWDPEKQKWGRGVLEEVEEEVRLCHTSGLAAGAGP